MNRSRLFRSLAALAAGVVFSAGLGVSGMTRPSKVIGFLDLFGRWDPSLALVMGSAVCIGSVAFRLILRRPAPLLASCFILPTAGDIDLDLLLGAVLFGIGWGVSGLCPGPALVGLVTGAPGFLLFVATMAAGAVAATRLKARRRASAGVFAEVDTAKSATTRGAETTCA
jgi:uncharacterized protein